MTDVQTQAGGSTRAKAAASSSKLPPPTGPVDATTIDPKTIDKMIAAGWHGNPGDHSETLYPPAGGGSGGGGFNSKHPRAAKGSPTGGEFISSSQNNGSGQVAVGKGKTVNSSDAIKAVQDALGAATTGKYDAATEKAVREFQQEKGLRVDGVIGTQTATAILESYKNPDNAGKAGQKVKPGSLKSSELTQLAALGQKTKSHGNLRTGLLPIGSYRHPYPVAAVATLRTEPDERATEGIRTGIDYILRRYGTPDAASAAYDRMAHEKILGDKPDSPGLWHHKGRQIPAYMQHVINDLIEGGTPRELAIPRGIGIVKNWAEGHDGKGNTVHPDTVAKAAAAVAEWEALRGATHAETAAKAAKRTSGRHTVYSRTYNLEDISVRSGPYEDGRTVEAYAAVYDVPARIHDHEGEYEEVLDRTCFDRAVDHARPQGGRAGWKCGVFYNHARTIFGTPSDRHSEPIGVCLDIRPDQRGLLTVTRYLPAADNILDAIREGAITSYSFSGSFMRSTPQLPGRGAKYRAAPDGSLTQVRRLESSLREYGPTPFPAYDEAQVVGMRADQIAMALTSLDQGERDTLVEFLRADPALLDDTEAVMQEAGTSTGTPDDGSATGDSQQTLHSTRNLTNRLWRSRLRDALADHGIALPEGERQ